MVDALKATYADLKTVKTRGVCQIVLEMPIEGMADAFSLLGAPIPGNEVWVAIARLRGGGAAIEKPSPQIEHANDENAADDIPGKPPRPLSQVSAILCGIVAFRRFIMEQYDGWDQMPTADEAADWLREECGVRSRREFDTDENAAANFRDIRSKYSAWMLAA
jgi:hypothetical protein